MGDQKQGLDKGIDEIYYEFSKIRHGIVKGCDGGISKNRCFMSAISITSSEPMEVLEKTAIIIVSPGRASQIVWVSPRMHWASGGFNLSFEI